MSKHKPYYVDNRRLYEEIVKYKVKCKEHAERGIEEPRIPNYVGESISKIAEKLSYKPCFINYSFREEMVGDGVENCIMYFKDYNPEKGQNPFAYFTQIIWYAFLRRIGKEEKNRYTTYKYFQESFVNTGDTNFLVDDNDNHLISYQMYDNINEFMGRFEQKEKDKKKKRKDSKNSKKELMK
jgi:hypothetical protein